MVNNFAVTLKPAFGEKPQYWDGTKFRRVTDKEEFYCYTKDEAETEKQKAEELLQRVDWMGTVEIDQMFEPDFGEGEE